MAAAPWATAAYGFRGFVALYAISALAWFVVRRGIVSLRAAIAIAVVLRAMLLFAEPRLSGDVYRYLSDGRVLASGANPYEYTPADPRINHPEIRSIYPPHAQLLFAAFHQLALWRLLLIACDVAVLVSLREWPHVLLAYATFPPLIFEGAWSGHVEVVAAMLVVVAALRASGVALAIAAGLKITPIAAVFTLPRRRLPAFLAVLAVPFAVFAMFGPVMPGFRDYATRWIFNSPAYSVIFPLVERVPLKDFWTSIKDPLHLEAISGFVYRHVYPDFITRAVLGVCALVAIWTNRRSPLRSIAALLIFSPAIHPWYWLVLVPLAMRERSAWLWVALAAPLSYLLYEGANAWMVFALCYGLPLGAALMTRAVARRGLSAPLPT
ncbi:MAG TPA: hypothetical protein VF698_12585 [Thermoanaerobaculia bacterium]